MKYKWQTKCCCLSPEESCWDTKQVSSVDSYRSSVATQTQWISHIQWAGGKLFHAVWSLATNTIIVTVDLWLAKFLTYTKLFKNILLVVVVGSTGYVVGLTSFFGIFFTKAFENFHNKNWWEVWSRDASSSPTFLLGLAITFKSIELELNTLLQFQIFWD